MIQRQFTIMYWKEKKKYLVNQRLGEEQMYYFRVTRNFELFTKMVKFCATIELRKFVTPY